MKCVIKAAGLTKRFGELTAVDNIDFEVYQGECFGVLGPNGAGKTSTMKMLYDFSPRSGGTLEVFGIDPAGPEGLRARREIGVVPQSDNLDQELTVRENLQVYGSYFGIRGAELKERVNGLIKFIALDSKSNSRIKELSGGMKRRLTIARSLIGNPGLVILDEPSTGLDPQARHHVWAALRQLIARGVTIVLTTHYMDEAERLCDRLIIMDRGKILEIGTPKELIARHLKRMVLEAGVHDLAEDWRNCAAEFEIQGDRVFFSADNLYEFEGILFKSEDAKKLIRPSNIEDLFLKLTGRSLDD